ncbi:MAG: 7-cyano-7-deazaguanine synthase [Proteobacteria bacterium]|nr:7-cyano-7-deazaguanine synthase [Pseudomonadota bacterium]
MVGGKERIWSGSGNAVVLLSGGLDSAACLHLLRSQGTNTLALHISHGQPSEEFEAAAARRVADHYGVSLDTLAVAGGSGFEAGEISGRNAFFALAALMYRPFEAGVIAIGIHGGTPYKDCSSTFVEGAQRMFDLYTDGRVRLAAPFLEWSKAQVLDYCRTAEVPVDATYSCEHGTNPVCGNCLSCKDRQVMAS